MSTQDSQLRNLADLMVLGDILNRLNDEGGFELVVHWTQGEFHHDLVVRAFGPVFGGTVLVIATNCNGGVKEIVALREVPERDALWRWRCPDNDDFEGELVEPIAVARTIHWFDPDELLTTEARSELRPEHRERQKGGGWVPTSSG